MTTRPGQTSVDSRPDADRYPRKFNLSNNPVSDKQCYKCGVFGHLARDCSSPKTESGGRRRRWNSGNGTTHDSITNLVTMFPNGDVERKNPSSDVSQTLHSCQYPGSSNEVRQVRIVDRGSHPQRVRVLLEGVPTLGIIDSGSDITIMGQDLLKRVAAAARLGKDRVDKTPKTYAGQPFALHGRMDLDVTFDGRTMRTPVYIKLDTPEPLLLSEGVCRQLRILDYHPSVVKQMDKLSSRVEGHGGDAGRDGITDSLVQVQEARIQLESRSIRGAAGTLNRGLATDEMSGDWILETDPHKRKTTTAEDNTGTPTSTVDKPDNPRGMRTATGESENEHEREIRGQRGRKKESEMLLKREGKVEESGHATKTQVADENKGERKYGEQRWEERRNRRAKEQEREIRNKEGSRHATKAEPQAVEKSKGEEKNDKQTWVTISEEEGKQEQRREKGGKKHCLKSQLSCMAYTKGLIEGR